VLICENPCLINSRKSRKGEDVLNSLFSLEGKVAIVTGGAGYLGREMSKILSEAGAHVIIASRNLEKLKLLAEEINRGGGKADVLQFDMTIQDSVNEMVQKTVDRYGKIDILVNNASGGATNTVEDMTLEEWNLGFAAGVTGYFLCTKTIGSIMKKERKGSIINVASILGFMGDDQRRYINRMPPANYSASKGAIIQLTRYLATYWASYGIRVNTLSPGPFPPDGAFSSLKMDEIEKKVPLGRIGKPEEIAGPLLFLASDASSYVTGHNLVADGGWSVW